MLLGSGGGGAKKRVHKVRGERKRGKKRERESRESVEDCGGRSIEKADKWPSTVGEARP